MLGTGSRPRRRDSVMCLWKETCISTVEICWGSTTTNLSTFMIELETRSGSGAEASFAHLRVSSITLTFVFAGGKERMWLRLRYQIFSWWWTASRRPMCMESKLKVDVISEIERVGNWMDLIILYSFHWCSWRSTVINVVLFMDHLFHGPLFFLQQGVITFMYLADAYPKRLKLHSCSCFTWELNSWPWCCNSSAMIYCLSYRKAVEL